MCQVWPENKPNTVFYDWVKLWAYSSVRNPPTYYINRPPKATQNHLLSNYIISLHIYFLTSLQKKPQSFSLVSCELQKPIGLELLNTQMSLKGTVDPVISWGWHERIKCRANISTQTSQPFQVGTILIATPESDSLTSLTFPLKLVSASNLITVTAEDSGNSILL